MLAQNKLFQNWFGLIITSLVSVVLIFNQANAQSSKDEQSDEYHCEVYTGEKALESCSRLISKDPKNPEFWYLRAFEYRTQNKLKEALEDIKQAVRLDQNSSKYFNYRGYLNILLNNYDTAFDDFNRAINLNDKDLTIYSNRATVWNKRGEFDKALADLNHSIEGDPNLSRSYYHRSAAYKGKGDLEKALLDINKYLQLGLADKNEKERAESEGNVLKNEIDKLIEEKKKRDKVILILLLLLAIIIVTIIIFKNKLSNESKISFKVLINKINKNKIIEPSDPHIANISPFKPNLTPNTNTLNDAKYRLRSLHEQGILDKDEYDKEMQRLNNN